MLGDLGDIVGVRYYLLYLIGGRVDQTYTRYDFSEYHGLELLMFLKKLV